MVVTGSREILIPGVILLLLLLLKGGNATSTSHKDVTTPQPRNGGTLARPWSPGQAGPLPMARMPRAASAPEPLQQHFCLKGKFCSFTWVDGSPAPAASCVNGDAHRPPLGVHSVSISRSSAPSGPCSPCVNRTSFSDAEFS